MISSQGNPSRVDHPTHYNQGEIECIDAMLAAGGEDAVKKVFATFRALNISGGSNTRTVWRT